MSSPGTSGAPAPAKALSPSVRVLGAFLVARGVFGLVYLGMSTRRWPIPWYYPLARRWAIEPKPSGLAMGWYGLTMLALLGASAAGALVWFGTRRGALRRWLAEPSVVRGLARAGALILLVDFAYFGWTMMHQTPSPIPLPAWYCPR